MKKTLGVLSLLLLAACSAPKPPAAPQNSLAAAEAAAEAARLAEARRLAEEEEARRAAAALAAAEQAAKNPFNLSEADLSDENSVLAKRSIYFDLDSAVIRDEHKPSLEAHSSFLKLFPKHQILIQGNTDVRGSREYNLALGQRRAESVKSMMQVLGVPESQLEAVSLGKEKPRARGSSEQAHAENRRADLIYKD